MVGTLVISVADPPNSGAFTASSPYWVAENFSIGTTNNIGFIGAFVSKIGTPPDTVTVRIETDNAGNPSGTLVDANATVSYPVASMPVWTTLSEVILQFPGSFSLSASTTYFVVYRLSYTDTSNRCGAGVDTTNPYPSGVRHTSTNSGSSWTETAGQDISFNLYGPDAPAGYSNKVLGVTPSKVNGIAAANISKVNGI